MLLRQRFIIATILATTSAVVAGQNLVFNGGNELPLLAGEIQGWTEVVGTNWTQRLASPPPFEGSNYFFAGVSTTATLRQTIDLSLFSTQIDTGSFNFSFEAFVRSFDQSSPDSSRVTLTYLSDSSAVLGLFNPEEIISTTSWQRVAAMLAAPVATRSIQIDLIATRNSGANNDGYFDSISLSPVPEPATYQTLLVGLAGVVSLRLRQSKAKARSGRRSAEA